MTTIPPWAAGPPGHPEAPGPPAADSGGPALPWQQTGVPAQAAPPDPSPTPTPPLLPAGPVTPREMLRLAHAVVARCAQGHAAPGQARAAVRHHFQLVRDAQVAALLAETPVGKVRDITEGRLRLTALENVGIRTLADVLCREPWQLATVPGVGEATATKVVAAAHQMRGALSERVRVRFDIELRPPEQTDLLLAIFAYERAERLLAPLLSEATVLAQLVAKLADEAALTRSRVRMTFTLPGRRREARQRLAALESVLRDGASCLLAHRLTSALAEMNESPTDVWRDFAQRAADYYGILGLAADQDADVAAAHGFIPAEIAAQVNRLQLDLAHLRNTSLRGYQAFGAKYAIVQRRSIIGDEMGLGKTIEALAVMSHLAGGDASHFLVVCPAGVLVNWMREVRARSRFTAYLLHGQERTTETKRWLARGGVGVTTHQTLSRLPMSDAPITLLVVDEAHYAKNPAAARSQAVALAAEQVERVLFLTGTPMENRVAEFRTLVNYLRPDIARHIDPADSLAGSAEFRRTVAPVYLRRNQEDVLAELPERLETNDWISPTRADLTAYREAVAAKNFMSMRRAAFHMGDVESSAKMQRLAEIVGEAAESGWKVVAFSFFRDVLDIIRTAGLAVPVFGPLTGSVTPVNRQRLVDEFSAHAGPALLLGQIEAGGTGLNIQAASVVVLTEPQWKPTIEEQALARCHRMGQVRRVHVHRLLATNSVDQRMLEVLDRKRALFDGYARRSAIRDASPDAVDISNVEAARSEAAIIEAERSRLGL